MGEGEGHVNFIFPILHSPEPENSHSSAFLFLVLHIYRSLSAILTPHLSKLFIPLILQSELQSRSSLKNG